MLQNLEAAKLLYDSDMFNAAANRSYYAAFHIAIATLYHIGLIPNIDHKTINSLFSDNFINRKKLLPSKYKMYFSELQDKRNIADYKSGISMKLAKNQLKLATEFVNVVNEVIK